MKKYDYIISGSGAAGLSLLMRMIVHPYFGDKQILVVDKVSKTTNDRTWCFWENEPGLFQPIVYHHWERVHFYSDHFSSLLHLAPYHYKMIRGIDFYNYVISEAKKHTNITFAHGNVEGVGNENDYAFIVMDGIKFVGSYIFNSIQFEPLQAPAGKYYLLQHFKGWMIETVQPFFNQGQATLMDFRVSQQHGTTFGYVLPVSPTAALVEYTLFTRQLLQQHEYNEGLKNYISQQILLNDYTVTSEEFGVIPMTNMKFSKGEGRVLNIGTAGGQTKASSGYTFQFIQKQTQAIVDSILKDGLPTHQKVSPSRFHFYDSTLLNILYNNKLPGDKIFSDLFSKSAVQHLFRFLDNESTLAEELRIVWTLPTFPFLRAALQEIVS